jgi:ubiquinone/menaquinone biosynthesis C-methylase UbiE
MKDNFSSQSSEYARFRPGYPPQLFSFLFTHCQHFDNAWDCATGNGQIALHLAERFGHIEATDISENQLKNALLHPKVRYTLQTAEKPTFGDESFDLIVVGQAAHWFALDRFYTQVRRVMKQDGLLALVGYQLLTVDPAIDALIHKLYVDVLGAYWDAERRYVDTAYTTIPFPFDETPFPEMSMTYEWTRNHLIGYLGTWSALQHFTRQNGHTALDADFLSELETLWPDDLLKTVTFPIFGRVGRV